VTKVFACVNKLGLSGFLGATAVVERRRVDGRWVARGAGEVGREKFMVLGRKLFSY